MLPDLLDGPLEGYDPEAVIAAEATVRSFCEWHIAPTVEVTLTVDGSGTRELVLPTLQIASVSAVVENGRTVPADEYEVIGSRLRRRHAVWGYESTVVTFAHGYETCPPDVARVVARMARGGLTGGIDHQTGARVRSSTEGPYAVTYDPDSAAGELDIYAERILARYRLAARA